MSFNILQNLPHYQSESINRTWICGKTAQYIGSLEVESNLNSD